LDHQHQIDLIPTLLAAHAIPPEYQANPDAYINLIIDEILPQIVPRSRGRSTQFACEFVDVFCEQHVFTVAQARRLLESARARGLSLKIHADEFVNSGAGKLAAELHAVSADHLQHTPLRAVRAMARAKVIGILLPATTLALMSHNYVDARKMIRTGLPIALGTDFNPNCWALSMQFIITLACYYMQMYPEEAIVAATINAAHAINRAHEVGSLEVGKKADIIILDVPNYMHIPYQFDVNIVDHVIKNGRIIK
jgi:imidazolonepropionase